MIRQHCELVKIVVEHPEGSTTNVKGRIGVVTKSETVIDENTNDMVTTYTVKDDHGESYVYLRDELDSSVSELEARYYLTRLILKM